MDFFIILNALGLIFGGILCLMSLIAKKNPNAADKMKPIVAYQGWIGIVILVLGLVVTIWRALLSAVWYCSYYSVLFWITLLVGGLVAVVVGFFLGFGMIQRKSFANAPAEARAGADMAVKKLAGLQIPLGYIALCVGIWTLLEGIIRL